MMRTISLLFALSLLSAATALDYRHLLQQPDADGWMEGRATWYEHPWTGSCGYGKLDDAPFSYDAVAAMPDVFADYPGSCGRCFEVKCRGIQAVAADGSVNLDRFDACYDTNTSIVIKIVDTCPCVGNEAWCCGDMPHFDLGKAAFERLAPSGKGIIGLKWRPVPCEAAPQEGGNATPEDWAALETSIGLGASPDIFTGNEIGTGWVKTVYGDEERAMYTYNDSIEYYPDGSAALCAKFEMYGGMDFYAHKGDVTTFINAKGVEFWAKSEGGAWPEMAFRVANQMTGSCNKDLKLQDGATQDTVNGWTRFFFPITSFDCTGGVQPKNLNRVQWESKAAIAQLCVKDVRVVMNDEAPVAAAGR